MDEMHWKRFIVLAVTAIIMVTGAIWALSMMNDAMDEAVKVKQNNSLSSTSIDSEPSGTW